MKLSRVRQLLEAEVLCGENGLDRDIETGCGSDLMSDVLSSAEPGSLLLTGLANGPVVSTCAVADLAGIVFVQGKRPGPEVVREAQARRIPLLATRMTMFEACARMAGLVEDGGHGRR